MRPETTRNIPTFFWGLVLCVCAMRHYTSGQIGESKPDCGMQIFLSSHGDTVLMMNPVVAASVPLYYADSCFFSTASYASNVTA
ncbi:insulin-like growth factor 1a receptor [Tachysurus ichikawai]